jgi:hypothetical protein
MAILRVEIVLLARGDFFQAMIKFYDVMGPKHEGLGSERRFRASS